MEAIVVRADQPQLHRLFTQAILLQVWILIPSICPPFFLMDISELQVHPWTAFDFMRAADDAPSSDSP